MSSPPPPRPPRRRRRRPSPSPMTWPPAGARAGAGGITAYARQLRAAGVDGTMDQLRARAFLDFTLGVNSFPPVSDPSADGQPSPHSSSAASTDPSTGAGQAPDSP